MIELCPRLFPAFARFIACVPNGVSIFPKVHLINPEIPDLGATLC